MLLRSDFHYAVRGLTIAKELLGHTVHFARNGLDVGIRFPQASDKGKYASYFKVLPVVAENANTANIRILVVEVRFEIPYSVAEYQRAENALRETLNKMGSITSRDALDPEIRSVEDGSWSANIIADQVATQFVQHTRVLRRQSWLSWYGEAADLVFSETFDAESEQLLRRESGTGKWLGHSDLKYAVDGRFVQLLVSEYLRADHSTSPPIAEGFLADASFAMHIYPDPDPVRAVLLAAIACEILAKQVFRSLNVGQIDGSLSVAKLLDRISLENCGFSLRTRKPTLYHRVNKLFRLRNQIAHEGFRPEPQDGWDGVNTGWDCLRARLLALANQ